MKPKTPTHSSRYEWKEDHELDFLANLGKSVYQNKEACRQLRDLTRSQLLERYITAASWRVNWGIMRPNRILAACRRMLQEECSSK